MSTALIAVIAGWWFDHRRLTDYYQIREDQMLTSSRLLSTAESNSLMAAQFRSAPDEFGDVIAKRLILDLVMIRSFRAEIHDSGRRPETAARQTLSALDCKTADDFFSLADGAQFGKTVDDLILKSEIRDPESRAKLRLFVEESLSFRK